MDLRAIEVSFATLCALWWALTLFAQVAPRRALAFRRHDVFGLLPAYRFFAPRPRFRDHIVEYRFSGEETWTPLLLRGKPGIAAAFWNPHALATSLCASAVESLLRAQANRGDDAASSAFQRVAALVRAEVTRANGRQCQFRILTRNAGDPGCEPLATFQSPWLTLKP